MKGVKKAYLTPPPPTGQLPEQPSGSSFKAELDKREASTSHKATIQPLPTGLLPEFYNGEGRIVDNPKPEPVKQEPQVIIHKYEVVTNPQAPKTTKLSSKGVTKAYTFLPPKTGTLPILFSGSAFRAELDKVEANKQSYKATLQPPPTGKLPTFFNGEGKVVDNPIAEPGKLDGSPLPRHRTTWEGKKNTRRNRSATLSFHKTTIKGRR